MLGPALWLFGIVAVTALVRGRGWVLTTVGGVATTLALACGVGDLALYFGLVGGLARAGLGQDKADAVLTADGGSLVSTVLLLMFLAGWTLGPILLTIGLRPAQMAQVWLPVAAVIAGVANSMPGPVSGAVQLAALAATYLPLVVLLLRGSRATADTVDPAVMSAPA